MIARAASRSVSSASTKTSLSASPGSHLVAGRGRRGSQFLDRLDDQALELREVGRDDRRAVESPAVVVGDLFRGGVELTAAPLEHRPPDRHGPLVLQGDVTHVGPLESSGPESR